MAGRQRHRSANSGAARKGVWLCVTSLAGTIRYTESGILLPDNNALERQIRPIALGRANWTFAGSPRGAKVAATMY
jgi:hypothetical protein